MVLHWTYRPEEPEEMLALALAMGVSPLELAVLVGSAEDGDLVA